MYLTEGLQLRLCPSCTAVTNSPDAFQVRHQSHVVILSPSHMLHVALAVRCALRTAL